MKRNVLILALVIGFAVSACGRKTVEQNPADFKISEYRGMLTITDYIGTAKDVVIPKKINGRPVVDIFDSAFSNCYSLENIIIPNSVIRIGNFAFQYCTSLTSINVVASNNTFSTQDGILYNKNKTVLHTYPAGKTNTSFTIPDSVTSIGDRAFSSCTSLTSVTFVTGSNIAKENFGVAAFPEKSKLFGGDSLKNAYATGKAGTYKRAVNGDTWTKQ